MEKVSIDKQILEQIKQYLLASVLPSREVQEIVAMLNKAEQIKDEK